MPSNYTGNPNIQRTPSPAPAPGALPIQSLPSDGTDNANAASVAQAFEVAADYIGHIQSAVKLDVPVINGNGVGFTAPTYVSFGGTVAPSGSAHISDGTRFVIKIILGGAVGTATFQTSMDGGNTFGATQTTAASMTDATSGITLAFAGTFTINGTATFRSAFTPQAVWSDSAGNVRSLVDHNGYPMGRYSTFTEEWQNWFATISSSVSPLTNNPKWNGSVASGGTILFPNGFATYSASGISLATTNTAGSLSTITTSASFAYPTAFASFVFEFEIGESFSAQNTLWAGITSGAQPDSSATYAWFRATGANWLAECRNAGAITSATAGARSASANNDPSTWRFRIELHGSASPYGQRARFWANESLVLDTTSNVPVTTLAIGFENSSTAISTGNTMYIGPVRGCWNRKASLSPL